MNCATVYLRLVLRSLRTRSLSIALSSSRCLCTCHAHLVLESPPARPQRPSCNNRACLACATLKGRAPAAALLFAFARVPAEAGNPASGPVSKSEPEPQLPDTESEPDLASSESEPELDPEHDSAICRIPPHGRDQRPIKSQGGVMATKCGTGAGGGVLP